MNKLIYLLPVLVLLYLGYLQYKADQPPPAPILTESLIPEFALPEIKPDAPEDTSGIFSKDQIPHEPAVINAFATWCTTCMLEHPQLITLSQTHNIPVYGIAFKDDIGKILAHLAKNGNPFRRIGHDETASSAIFWNIKAMPESFIIDGNGKIRYHHKGFISQEDLTHIFLPVIERLRQEQQEALAQ